VTSEDGATSLGTVAVGAGGAASKTLKLPVGSHAIVAESAGDGIDGPAVSSLVMPAAGLALVAIAARARRRSRRV
jgi:hypothetical protein